MVYAIADNIRLILIVKVEEIYNHKKFNEGLISVYNTMCRQAQKLINEGGWRLFLSPLPPEWADSYKSDDR